MIGFRCISREEGGISIIFYVFLHAVTQRTFTAIRRGGEVTGFDATR